MEINKAFNVYSLKDKMEYFSNADEGALLSTSYVPALFVGDLTDNVFVEDELMKYNTVKNAIETKNLDLIYDIFNFEEYEVITGAKLVSGGRCIIYYVDVRELEDEAYRTEDEALGDCEKYGLKNAKVFRCKEDGEVYWALKLNLEENN